MISDAEAVAILERDGWNPERGCVKWPTTPEGWCAWFRALDIRYGTDPNESPLGHNYRCPIHGTKIR